MIAGLVLATQSNADAAVTYSCGKNLNPSSASNTVTLEHKKGQGGTLTYPYISLREGIVDGYQSVIWARQSHHMEGSLDLWWYKSKNSTTHYDCEYESRSIYPRNYTNGVLVGENTPPGADALAFRPCQRFESTTGGEIGKWDCSAWFYF